MVQIRGFEMIPEVQIQEIGIVIQDHYKDILPEEVYPSLDLLFWNNSVSITIRPTLKDWMEIWLKVQEKFGFSVS